MSLTPSQIFEEKIAERLKTYPEQNVNTVYQFDVTGTQGGQWTIVLNETAHKVERGNSQTPHCVITIADVDLVNLVEGKLNPQLAFMTGKLKVKGDFGLALKLGSLLKA